MKLDKVLFVLKPPTRKAIVRILAEESMTVREVREQLSKQGINLKYRESVYKNLEKLVDSGLVEKTYDKREGMCYRLVKKQLKIDLLDWTVE